MAKTRVTKPLWSCRRPMHLASAMKACCKPCPRKTLLDIEISYEEANFIKETFIRDYQLREMALIPNKNAGVDTDMAPGEIKFESVDQIIIDQINSIESNNFDKKILLDIYNNL